MPLLHQAFSRRYFLALGLAVLPGFTRSPRKHSSCGTHLRAAGDHPTPRPGIDASKVTPESDLKGDHVTAAFNEVRQIPQIVDGIRCHCGCATLEGFYSLLTCYEGPHAMAQMCELCQGHGRFAFRLHKSGKTLDEIRKAIDDRYGG